MSIKGKKIGIIGHIDHGKTTLNAAIIESLKENKVTKIETVTEMSKEEVERKIRHITHRIKEVEVYSPYESEEPRRVRELSIEIINNIHAEYNLIKEKKSKLSRWERDKVVALIEAR